MLVYDFLFQEILFGPAFKEKLEEVLEKHKEFECPYGYTDSYGKRKLKQYNVVEEALNAMKAHCVEQGINIVELFSRFDQDGSMSVTHDEFKEGLRVSILICKEKYCITGKKSPEETSTNL